VKEGAVWPEPGDGVPSRPPGAPGLRDPTAPRHESAPPPLADRAASTADLARIAADQCPDASAEAPDWFLGPWADILTSADGAVLATALAQHALVERGGTTSAEVWARDAAAADRAAVRAAGRAPLGLWRVAALDGSNAIVEDLVGLGEGWAPNGTARLGEGGGVLGAARSGGTVLARAVRTASGWVLVAPLALPTRLPALAVARAVDAALALAPRASLETALARHGVGLARAAHSHAWGAA